MRTIIALTAAAVLLGACASSGTKVSDQQVASFVVGKSTIADVKAALGPPEAESNSSDGLHVLVYAFSHADIKGATFIPIVGLFAGGANVQSQSVAFTFDRDGVLTKETNTNSAVESTNHGFGYSTKPVAPPP